MRRGGSWFHRLGWLVFSVLLFVVLLDRGVAWWFGSRQGAPDVSKIFTPYPGQKCMNYSPAPGGKDFWERQYKAKAAAQGQILILGDSVAAANDKNAWPWLIHSQLENAVGKKLDLNIKVAARPGWGSEEREKALAQHRPRLFTAFKGRSFVLWVITPNDLLDENTVLLSGNGTRISGVCRDKASVCKNIFLEPAITGLLPFLKWKKQSRQNTVSVEAALAGSAGVVRTKSALKHLHPARVNFDANPYPPVSLVVVMPSLWPKPSPFQPITDKAIQLGREAGLPVLDLSDALLEHPMEKLRCSPADYVHPPLNLHPAIAAEVAGFLARYEW